MNTVCDAMPNNLILNLYVTSFSEMSVNCYQVIQRRIQEDGNLRSRNYERLKSCLVLHLDYSNKIQYCGVITCVSMC